MALARIKRGAAGGKDLAKWGLVLGYVGMALLLLYFGYLFLFKHAATPPPPPPPPAAEARPSEEPKEQAAVDSGRSEAATPDFDWGMIAHYKFEGNFKDNCGGRRNGISSGVKSVSGRVGKGAFFDGKSNSVSLPVKALNNLPEGSVALWVGVLRRSGDLLVRDYGNGSAPAGMRLSPMGVLQASLAGFADAALESRRTMSFKKWNHVAWVWDGQSQRLYLNGELDCESPAQGGVLDSESGWLKVGEGFKGKIDELRLYKRALSATEVKALYESDKGGKPEKPTPTAAATPEAPGVKPPAALRQGLVIWLPFRGSAIDASDNGNNGAIRGAKLVEDRLGNRKRAYCFDGERAELSVPFSPSLDIESGYFAISLWYKLEPGSNKAELVSRKNNEFPPNGWTILVDNGVVYFKAKDTKSVVLSSRKLGDAADSSDAWHNVIVNKIDAGGQGLELYLDGVLAARGPGIDCGRSDAELKLGYSLEGHSKVSVDELRIYKRPLAPDEIQKLAGKATAD